MFSPPVHDDDYQGYPHRRYSQQLPAFGSWDCFQDVDDLSRCFEAARQAGYIRYAADRDLYVAGDLYEDNVVTPTMIVVPRPMTKVGREEEEEEEEEKDKEKSWVSSGDDVDGDMMMRMRNPKPVDEDLYKISPQFLNSIKSNHRRSRKKKKKMMGVWRVLTCCLIPCY